MLEDGECSLRELAHERDGGVDVEQIVVGDFLAVELLQQVVETAEEIALLMRVFTVAHSLFAVDGDAQGSGVLGQRVEIAEYG